MTAAPTKLFQVRLPERIIALLADLADKTSLPARAVVTLALVEYRDTHFPEPVVKAVPAGAKPKPAPPERVYGKKELTDMRHGGDFGLHMPRWKELMAIAVEQNIP